ncbi:MAG TPA: serpin family protein [Candidatus Limnocylindria bacterium]|nr:serpin family protein [Candidatus Limnocylindria bacterium]
MTAKVLALLLLVALVGGCAAAPLPSATADLAPTPTGTPLVSWEPGVPGLAMSTIERAAANPADAALAAAAINDFGLELLRDATAHDENAVLSPASIVLALAMARAGARGDTAAEMDEVLRGAASDEHVSWLNALDAALAVRSGTFKDRFNEDADVLLRIANQSFAQQDFPFEASYLDALAARFGAGLRLVDFELHAEAARRDINAWVSDQTKERIPELLPQGSVDDLTRLVLVNAIYLKAAWLSPFEEEATEPATFTRLDGSSIEIPTMHDTSGFRYAEGDDWQAVELPYVGRQLAMLIVLPDNLPAFEAALDGAGLDAITAALEDRRVQLSLPRFGIESKLGLNEVLSDMGMPLAFDPPSADFSGITPVSDLYISDVIHQANIDVDEEGTEAAAATGVVMGITSMPPEPIPLTVDRPFLFALRDVETGAILFLGRVVEPMERN